MDCSICGNEIEIQALSGWAEGNNAEPVVEEGRCCDICDASFVIPARMEALRTYSREKLIASNWGG